MQRRSPFADRFTSGSPICCYVMVNRAAPGQAHFAEWAGRLNTVPYGGPGLDAKVSAITNHQREASSACTVRCAPDSLCRSLEMAIDGNPERLPSNVRRFILRSTVSASRPRRASVPSCEVATWSTTAMTRALDEIRTRARTRQGQAPAAHRAHEQGGGPARCKG
jgi:hypothetical protein